MKVEYPKYNEKQDGRIKITSEIAEEMQSLRREGHAVTWLAKHYGISLSTVVYHTDERQRDKILTRNRMNLRQYRNQWTPPEKRKRELQKQYRKKMEVQKEEMETFFKKDWETNKEKYREKNKKDWECNKEKLKEKNRQYYLANKEEQKRKARERYYKKKPLTTHN